MPTKRRAAFGDVGSNFRNVEGRKRQQLLLCDFGNAACVGRCEKFIRRCGGARLPSCCSTRTVKSFAGDAAMRTRTAAAAPHKCDWYLRTAGLTPHRPGDLWI